MHLFFLTVKKMVKKLECSVCVSVVARSNTVTCGSCDYTCCKKCMKRYILSSNEDPHCMNCKKRLDRVEMIRMLSATFVNTAFRDWRRKVLFQRELSLMSVTQPFVQQECKRRENLRILRELQVQRARLRAQVRELDGTIITLQANLVPPLDTGEKKRAPFVHKCSQENCRGFLARTWKCNVCEKYTCSECNAPLTQDEEHVCDVQDRETMRLLRSDSKMCPSCGVCIQRVSGCDQMWCTQCATAFSWRDRTIINGAIHNPHFYEYQRNFGTQVRNPGDIPCGGMPTYRELVAAFPGRPVLSSHARDYFFNLHRLIIHIEQVEMPRYRVEAHDVEDRNMDLRVLYTLSEISEETFRQKIEQREKSYEKRRDIFEVLELVTQSGADSFRQTVIDHNFSLCTTNCVNLLTYANDTLQTIARRFKCVVPQMDVVNLGVTMERF